MVEDLMAIVHTFSCRLYGMRKYKKQIQEDFAEHKIGQVRDDLQ
jgi:predicted site-specific integrase-resolvase